MREVESRIQQLEARVAELEDRSAIQDLRFRYHVAVNERQLEALPALFTPDAEVAFDGIGSARGRDAIAALYREVVGGSPFIQQFIHNHLIRLDGDTATGQSYLDARTVREGESVLVAARFDDAYARSALGPREWLFRSLRLTIFFAVPLAAGWASAVGDAGSRRDALD